MDNIYRFLIDIGVPTNLRGFDYLHDVVAIILENDELKHDTTYLYDAVAEIRNVKPGNVERCIRTAIFVFFKNVDFEIACNVFGETMARKRKAKNGEFITALALNLK